MTTALPGRAVSRRQAGRAAGPRGAWPRMRALLLGIALVALAISANVADETALRNAITDASVDVINFTADISVTADLPAVQCNMPINGNGRTLSATGEFRGLFVGAWTAGTATQVAVTVTIQDLTIDGATARGGAGAPNAGGGAGLGGALHREPDHNPCFNPGGVFPGAGSCAGY